MKSRVRFHNNLRVSIPEFRQVIHTNGKQNDRVWKEGAQLSPFLTFYENKVASPITEVVMGYDSHNLYVGLKSFYANRSQAKAVSDGIELVLKPVSSQKPYYHTSFMLPGSSKEVFANLGPGSTKLEGIDLEVIEGDSYCDFHLSIPLNSLNIQQIRHGDQWGINLLRHSIGSCPASSWAPIRHSCFYDRESSYDLVATVCEEGRLGTLEFGDADALSFLQIRELTYVGFTEKEITLDTEVADVHDTRVLLEWVTPIGRSHLIEHFNLTGENCAYMIQFVHPEPMEDGLYRLDLTLRGERDEIVAASSIHFDRMDLIEAGCEALQAEALDSVSVSADSSSVNEEVNVVPSPASDEVRKLIELIPDKMGMTFVGLPDQPGLRPYDLYSWQEETPNQITSAKSPYTFPMHPYEENREFTIKNLKGEEIKYPYYEDENGKKYFLSAHAWSRRRDYVMVETDKLASDDPLGAARLLYRFAQMYEGYFPVYDYPWLCYPMEKEAGPPYPYWGGLWNRWFYMDVYQLRFLFHAYGKINRTNAFQLLSEETGEDVRSRIVDQMFLPSVEFIKAYPNMKTNMDFANWIGLAALSKALNDPRYIHEVVERLKSFCMNQFLFDGFWKEVTLSYHRQIMLGIKKVTDEILGWKDPEGYISPRTGEVIHRLNMENQLPFLEKAMRLLDDVVYPNGHAFPVTDTWAYDVTDHPNLDTGSFLLPAAGISKMVRGTGPNQMQVYLTFVPKYGHNHLDPLNLVIFAHGQELLSDSGYTHTKYRYSTVSTIGHNTVTVNGADMSVRDGIDGGNIEVFAPVNGSLQVTRACQKNAYSVTEQYNRELWSIGFSDDDDPAGYVLDIFRVRGGERHEYSLHGDTLFDAHFHTDLTLHPYGATLLPEGVDFTEPEVEDERGDAGEHYAAYMFVKDVSKAVIEGEAYELNLVTKDENGDRAKLRIIGHAGDNRSELFIGKMPSLRGVRLSKEDSDDIAGEHYAPQMIVRREGESLHSDFVTLVEPISTGGHSKIRQMDVRRFDTDQVGDVAVIVNHGNMTDIILSTASADGGPISLGDISMHGKMGFIRMEGREVKQMMLLGGTVLHKGDVILQGIGTIKGTIRHVLRRLDNQESNAFVVDVPVSAHLKGSHMVVIHPDGKTHGYLIHDIRTSQGKVVLDILDMDPGFTIRDDGSSEMNYFPHTKWNGAHTFYIDPVVHLGYD